MKTFKNWEELTAASSEEVAKFKNSYPEQYEKLFNEHYGENPKVNTLNYNSLNATNPTRVYSTWEELTAASSEEVAKFKNSYPEQYEKLFNEHYGEVNH